MKILRPVLALFSAALLVVSLGACGGAQGASSQPAGGDSSGASGRIVIGFAQTGAESDWRVANTGSMRATFTEEKGYELLFTDAQQSPDRQIAAVRDFIAKKVDYIVIAPLQETGWDEVLQEAKEADIPVIIVDRMISVSDESLYVCWVGSDFRKEGDDAVLWMEERFTGQTLNIVHLQGSRGSSAQIGRTMGLEEGVNRNSGWHIVAQDTGDFAEGMGREIMERLLRQSIDIDLVFCENDNMAFGAMQALDDAHVPYGEKTDITIVSFDATRSGLEATLMGKISVDVECNPLHGPRVEEIIQTLERGELPVKRSFVEETVFDAKTLTQAVIDARDY